MTKLDWDKLKLDVGVSTLEQAEEDPYVYPSDDLEYIIAVGKDGTAIFLQTPDIHYSFFENARDMLEDNGFAIPEGLGAGIYKCHFHHWTSTDWESGMVDDWGFDCIDEPELITDYERYEENGENL
jgi:hypothetical protein